jgi:predicted KAP-like P-loop ATPase
VPDDRDLFHDRALDRPEQDRLERQPFARFLAEAILTMDAGESFVFALHGSWGAGKSTVLNFLEFYLTHPETIPRAGVVVPVVVKFNPWSFSGTEQLFRQFFSEFRVALGKYKDPASTVKSLAGHLDVLSRALTPLKWIPGITGTATVAQETITQLRGAAESAAKVIEADVTEARRQIRSALSGSEARFVVLIDDIDRLRPEEMIQVFQLVKAVADFPRTLYVLSFDRAAVKKALRGVKVDEPDQYLEKIVQAPFDLPDPDPSTVRTLFEQQLQQLRATASPPATAAENRLWIDLFNGGISSLIRMPRDLKRVLNILRYSFPPVRDEVYFPDFVAITVIRLTAPDIYEFLALNKELMTHLELGVFVPQEDTYPAQNKRRFETILDTASPGDRPFLHHLLRRIFAVWDQAYGGVWQEDRRHEWLRQRRVNAFEAFDTYFRLSVLPSSVSALEMRRLLEMLPDQEATAHYLVQASKQVDPDGQRRIEKVLRMLLAYLPQVPDDDLLVLLKVLLTQGDELCSFEDWSYHGPFCDDLIAALAESVLRRLTPRVGARRQLEEIVVEQPALATLAELYLKVRDSVETESVLEEGVIEWLERELRHRLPSAIYGTGPQYPLLLATQRLRPIDLQQFITGQTAPGSPDSCHRLIRLFHGAGAVDGDRMRERVHQIRAWLRWPWPGGPLFSGWSDVLRKAPEWLAPESRSALERILEADALTPPKPDEQPR